MTCVIDTIREFETPNFRVIVDAVEEDCPDISFDDTEETRHALEIGSLVLFCARARVIHKESGSVLGSDYLGNCIYKSLDDFQDHRECGAQTRKILAREGKFSIYRKTRKYEHSLSKGDKLKARGFATRERAEKWAQAHTTEPYDIFENAGCGSYFHDMVRTACAEARKEMVKLQSVHVRVA